MEAIKASLSERAMRNRSVSLESGSVDAQKSKDGGVIIMVTGSIFSKDASESPKQVRTLGNSITFKPRWSLLISSLSFECFFSVFSSFKK